MRCLPVKKCIGKNSFEYVCDVHFDNKEEDKESKGIKTEHKIQEPFFFLVPRCEFVSVCLIVIYSLRFVCLRAAVICFLVNQFRIIFFEVPCVWWWRFSEFVVSVHFILEVFVAFFVLFCFFL